MNRYFKIFLTSLLFLSAIHSGYAQPTLVLSETTAPSGSNGIVEFSVMDFTDITKTQFSLNWDITELEFVNIASINTNNNLNLNAANIDISNAANGNLVFDWEDANGAGMTLDDGMKFFSIEFKALIPEGASAEVIFSDSPTPILINRNASGSTNIYDADKVPPINGKITAIKGIPDVNFTITPIDEPSILCQGDQICYDIAVSDFDSILGMQFIVTWSGSVLKFNNSKNFGLEGFDEDTFKVKGDDENTPEEEPTDSVARGLWTTETFEGLTNGISLPDETILATMCFDVIGEPNASTTIAITGDGTTTQEIFNYNGEYLDFISNTQSISITDCASLIALSTRCQDIKKDETVCIDFNTSNFTDISAAKYTVTFNPEVLEFVSTENFNLPNLDASNITVNNGVLVFDWTGASSATLANGETIFSACFKAIGEIDSTSTLQYLNLAGTGYDVTNASGQSLQPQFSNCEIKIIPPTVNLTAPMESTPPNTQICIPITVENFINVGHIEMPIEWDPTVIEFLNINTTGLTGLTSANFKINDIANGRLELETWDSPIPEGITLPDGESIFEVCFQVVGDLGTNSPIIFPQSSVIPVFMQNANGQELDINSTNGTITIGVSGLVLESEAQEIRKNNSFCVDIKTSNFNEIVTAGYNHLYDPNVLRFDTVRVNETSFDLSTDNITSDNEGTIGITWTTDDTSNGTTIADGTTLYSLCFTTIGELGACSNFRLDTIQNITTTASAGDDIGTFDNTKDICIDNFGITVVDSLRPGCTGGDGQIRLKVSGDPGENFLYFVTKDGEAFITGDDVENDSIILSNLDEGEYSIRVNSIVDVSKSEIRIFNLALSEEDLPSIDLGVDIDAGCVEADTPISIQLDGSSFTLPPTGGTQYTTEWTALGTGQVEASTVNEEITTALAPGRYIFTVVIVDNGCIGSDTIEVFTTQPPRVQVSQGGTLGCTNSTLQLGLEVIDDNPNNIYEWTTNDGNIVSGNTSFSPTIDQEGIYKFTAIDTVNGCIGFDSTFVVFDTIKPSANAGPDLEMGCDDAFIRLNGTGSTGAQVDWDTPDGSSIFYPNASSRETADVTRVGTYIFTVTNQVNGCQATDTMRIKADTSLPVARAEEIAIIGCGVTDVKLDGTNSSQGANFAYQWENPNNELISQEDTIRTSTEGEFLLIVINIDNDNCIADTARVLVTEDKTEPETSISQSLVLGCITGCTPLEANVPEGDHYSYQWETTDGVFCGGEDTPIAMVQSIGVYKLVVKDLNNNCESSAASIVGGDGTEVTADPGPGRQIDCNNETVILDGRGSSNNETTSFSWTFEDGTEVSTETTAEVSLAGEYTLEILDSATGCNAKGKVIVLEDKIAPMAEAGEAPIVSGCVFPTGRRLNGTESDFGDNITYAWTTSSGIIVGDTSITAPEIASPGIYVLTVKNTTNGCFGLDEVIVRSDVEIPPANAGSDQQLSCDQPELVLAGITEELSPTSVILWTTQDGNIIGETDKLSVSVDAPGTYVLSITSEDGCETTDEVIVDSNIDAPEADAGQALTISCNDNLILNGTGTVGENISVEWTTEGGSFVTGADTYTPEINRGGSYTLTVLNTDNNCKSTALVIVTGSEELPVADAGIDQEICTNESMLNATLPAGDYNGNWTTLENSMVVNPNDVNSIIADLTEGANTYIWTLSNEACGEFSSDTVVVNVPTFPVAVDDVFELQADQNFNSINLVENDQINSDMFTVNILEQPATGELTEGSQGVFEFSTPARYFGAQQFQYEICSAACSELCDIANVRVVVLPGADVDTTNTVPNAITPNGDGLNDMLLIDELIFDALDFPQSELIIFNRWGDVVYKASPYNNDWQGTATNGDDLPEGTYYYILRLDIVEGETMKGDITILR